MIISASCEPKVGLSWPGARNSLCTPNRGKAAAKDDLINVGQTSLPMDKTDLYSPRKAIGSKRTRCVKWVGVDQEGEDS